MASVGPWLGGGGRRGGWDSWFGSPFSTDIWDPFDFVSGGRRGGEKGDDTTTALVLPNVDWRETDNAHIIRLDLPGVGKEEVTVQVEDENILNINGEWTKEDVDTNDRWHRVERRRGHFTRRFRLPDKDNVKLDEIKCALDKGVLTVEIPKREKQEAQRNVRSIDVA